MKKLKTFGLLALVLFTFNANATVDDEDADLPEENEEVTEASSEAPDAASLVEEHSALLMASIGEQLSNAGVACRPQLNILSNVLFRSLKQESRVGFVCSQAKDNRQLEGSILLKKFTSKGCTDANRLKVLSKVKELQPISLVCNKSKKGKEVTEALYIRKFEIKVRLF